MTMVTAVRQRPALGMAIATGGSRVTGLARTVALAAALGVTALGDAYNTANTVPNMVFTLVAGGVLTSAVVPILVRGRLRGAEVESASALLGVTCIAGAVASAVLAAAAPWVVRALTLGARSRGDYEAYVALTTTWLRLFAPQVGLYALSVLAVSIMSAQRRLALGAAAPIATNLITVGAAAAFIWRTNGANQDVGGIGDAAVLALGASTTLAVAAMTAIQLWGARRLSPGLRPRWEPRHPAVTRLVRSGGWMMLYVSVNQIGLAAVIAMASVTRGGVTAYQWAFTLMQLPYALVVVSITSAAFPDISRAAQTGEPLTATVGASATATLRLLIPAAAGLLLLAGPLAIALVGQPDSGLVKAALIGFAGSLLPFSLFQILTRACYAGHDTRTPALVNVVVNAVNILAALLFSTAGGSPSARLTGLALAHGLSYVSGTVLLSSILRRRRSLQPAALFAGQGRTLLGTLAMVSIMWPASRLLVQPHTQIGAMITATGLAAVGVAVYEVLGPGLRLAGRSGPKS